MNRDPIPKPERRIKQPKPLQARTPLKAKPKPGLGFNSTFKVLQEVKLKKTKLKQQGKVTRSWIAFRKAYLDVTPPGPDGLYQCAMCPRRLTRKEVTLDHIQPRSRRPDLRFDPENIQIACFPCNSEKGSRVISD